MKRPFPLQSLLLIFIPLTIAISLIVLWGFNQHQADMRQMIITRNQHTAQLWVSPIFARKYTVGI